jgi:hypothetical protein
LNGLNARDFRGLLLLNALNEKLLYRVEMTEIGLVWKVLTLLEMV